MYFKQLQYFVRVAELGSISRAANVLDIAQPALSRQIRQLEVELRQNLFVRTGRGVRTTEAGQLLLEHGRGILYQVERAREELSRVGGALAGRVSIGLPPSIAQLMTVPLMHEFRKRLPHAALAVSEGMTPSIIEGLNSGRLDVALLYNPIPSPDLETTPLIEEELALIVPRKPKAARSPITLSDVAKLPLVMPGRLHTIRRLVEAEMASISRKPNIAFEIDGLPAILSLVADGAGYGVMPARIVQESHPSEFLARPIVKPSLISKLTMAISSKRATTLTQRAVIDLIRDVTARIPGLNVIPPAGPG